MELPDEDVEKEIILSETFGAEQDQRRRELGGRFIRQ